MDNLINLYFIVSLLLYLLIKIPFDTYFFNLDIFFIASLLSLGLILSANFQIFSLISKSYKSPIISI